MDEPLITKKELLERTGISYGQLYRWKRKNLIPENWFIRKATYTGQETFFPEKKILNRVHVISEMKDTLSLDELAEHFSPRSVTKIFLSEEQMLDQNIVSTTALNLFKKQRPNQSEYPFIDLLAMFLLDQMLSEGQMNRSEASDLLNVMQENSSRLYDKNSYLYFIRKMGVSVVLIAADEVSIFFDQGVHVIKKQSISSNIEKLKKRIESINAREISREGG
ncbi:YhbD family protein [Sporolactobacillus terrae]|uniref:YhbD family protein n=1 Tax=Sporolactobacillus terrae TaxID=269673 RepID=UPI00111A1FC9|nr:YhbD family protein [Sporolactobacillus terrae]